MTLNIEARLILIFRVLNRDQGMRVFKVTKTRFISNVSILSFQSYLQK
jgi:hypothetical protein